MPTEQEWGTFLQTLYEKLPVTFRINSGSAQFQRVSQMIKDPEFIKQFIERAAAKQAENQEEGKEEKKDGNAVNMDQTKLVTETMKDAQIDFANLRMDVKPFYPHEVLFEMMIPREMLKKNIGLKQVHKLVMLMADSGLITRQEIVSMMPPLLLDVQADHSILDMCAAPGSKTAQLLELIQVN